MNLSASINFFNSEETLLRAALSIRPLVDHLSIVYQAVSNYGHPISPEALIAMDNLRHLGIVDDWSEYKPDSLLSGAQNEYQKRKRGLNIARDIGASHFLLMDADEFYVPSQFEDAKSIIERYEIKYSCVHSYFYVKKPIYRSLRVDTTNVCFIAKIDEDLIFDFDGNFPADSTDPTRRLSSINGEFMFFDEKLICMHHMNFVRKSFDSKLLNTSSAPNKEFIELARKALESWEYPKKFEFPNKPPYEIIRTENLFDIEENIYKERPRMRDIRQFLKNLFCV